jgi:predicted XRE-type DNA-binding protein
MTERDPLPSVERQLMSSKRRTPIAATAVPRKAPRQVAFEEGSGNVFVDLHLADAAELQAKADLTHVIINIVEDHAWTQKVAASVLGIAESEMSDIMNGKLRRFSRERLERYLNALGMDIRIQVYPRPAGKPHAGVTVQVLATA